MRLAILMITVIVVIALAVTLIPTDLFSPDSTSNSNEESAYNLVRDELQLATTGYLTDVYHDYPVVIGSSQRTIAICELVGPDELLREVPDGCRVANCRDIDGIAACDGCADTNHYEWRVDDNGNVYSVCVDVVAGDCAVADADGYQGTWP
jgi:uncharacterized protein YpmB